MLTDSINNFVNELCNADTQHTFNTRFTYLLWKVILWTYTAHIREMNFIIRTLLMFTKEIFYNKDIT